MTPSAKHTAAIAVVFAFPSPKRRIHHGMIGTVMVFLQINAYQRHISLATSIPVFTLVTSFTVF
jgi:hypothetical protein